MQHHLSVDWPKQAQTPTSPPEAEVPPAIPCQALCASTLIQTTTGQHPLSTLSPGQQVLTRSGAFAPITRIDRTAFTRRQLHDLPDAAPIRFDPGALPGIPDGPTTLMSPDCPIAWSQASASLGRFPARAFCDGGPVRWVIPDDGIHYIRLHFAVPHEICVGGIWIALSPETETGATPETETAPSSATPPKLVHDIRIFRPCHV